MPISIRVKNFQSLRDTGLTVSGLTVITGPNNAGKTALLRAVFSSLTNAKGTHFVSHGEASCKVSMDFGGGDTLVWEKGAGVSRYVVRGHEISKMGHTVPDEVRSFGVVPVGKGDREVWPQIAEQFGGQVFLSDLPGSVTAEYLSDTERVRQVNEALRLSQADLKRARSAVSSTQELISRAERDLSRFADFDSLLRLRDAIVEVEKERSLVSSNLDDLVGLSNELGAASSLVSRLLGVDDVFLPPAIDSDLRELEALADELRSLSDTVRTLDKVGDVVLPDPLTCSHLEALATVSSAIRSLSATAGISLPEIPPPINLDPLRWMEGVLHTQTEASKVVISSAEEISELEEKMASLRRATSKAISDMGECPTCGYRGNHGQGNLEN